MGCLPPIKALHGLVLSLWGDAGTVANKGGNSKIRQKFFFFTFGSIRKKVVEWK